MWLSSEVIQSIPSLIDGWMMTVALTVLGSIGSLVWGHVALAMQLAPLAPVRWLARLYISFMRGTPALVQLFLVYFSLPLIGLGGRPMLAAALTLGLNSGAYTAEILRGNLRVVTPGQIEAATALGMAPWRLATRIVMPQVLRTSTPGLINEFTVLLKTTPLASVVAVTELTYAGQMVIARTYTSSQIMLMVCIGYLAVVLPILALSKNLSKDSRRTAAAATAAGSV